MGVHLKVGTAQLVAEETGDSLKRKIYVAQVGFLQNATAPTFEGSKESGQSNRMHFPTGTLQDTIYTVGKVTPFGLESLFFHPESGILAESSPGLYSFDREDVEEVEFAVGEFRRHYPDLVPRFQGSRGEAALARMMWLAWWMRYALDNCENQAIEWE